MCSWVGDVRLAERAYYVTRHEIFHNCQSQRVFLPPKPFRKNVKTSHLRKLPQEPLKPQTYGCVIHLLMIKLCWHTANAIPVLCECG